jgi:hypothetical protein
MSLRIGVVLVVTGLLLALALGAVFVVIGMFLAVCGGLVTAIGMETTMARESLETDGIARQVDPSTTGPRRQRPNGTGA